MTKRRFRRSLTIPTVAAIGTIATVGTVSGVDTSPDMVAANPVAGTLAAGQPATAAQVSRLRDVPETVAFKPDLTAARSVTTSSGATWTVVPAADNGACIVAPEGLTCGSGTDIKTGQFGFTATDIGTLTRMQLAANRKAIAARTSPPYNATTLPGKSTKYGLAPDRVSIAVAVDASGREISRTSVKDGVCVLNLGVTSARDGSRAVRLLTAYGEVVAEAPLNTPPRGSP